MDEQDSDKSGLIPPQIIGRVPPGGTERKDHGARGGPGVPSRNGYPAYSLPGYVGAYGAADGVPPWARMNWDVASILAALWRKKWTLVAAILFFVISACYYIAMVPRTYEANVVLELSLRRPRIMAQEDAVISDTGRSTSMEIFNSQLLKLRGPTLRRQVLQKVRPVFAGMDMDDSRILAWLERYVKIELLRHSSLVRISVRSREAEQSALIANRYAEEAVANAAQLNKGMSTNAVIWLQAQIEVQRKELDKAEQLLLDFRKQNPLDTLEAQRDTSRESLLAYNKQLTEASGRRDELLARYTVRHPEVLAQDQVIAAARRQYDDQLKTTEALESKIAQVRMRLNALERERDASELTFKGILNRIEEARLSADENTATMQISDRAEVPERPVWPRKALILILSVFLGGVIGTFLVLVTIRLEDRVWNMTDVTAFMGLRLLGLIPHVAAGERERLALKSHEDKFSIFTEAHAGIRGMIDASVKGKVFMVTSALPEEGKTVSAVNLATAWAKAGNRTLLVDLDLRQPRLHRIFSVVSAGHSLLEVLSGEKMDDLPSLPAGTDIRNLDVIVSRVKEDLSPAEVFGSRHVRDFLKWASATYDRVVLDAPPVGAASETLVVGSLVDGVVLVCRFNKSQKSVTKSAAFRLQDAGAQVIGIVVNDVRVDKSGLSKQFGAYYSGYHYPAKDPPAK